MIRVETPWVSGSKDTAAAGCKLSFYRTSSRVTHSSLAAPSGQGVTRRRGGGGVVRNDTMSAWLMVSF